MSHFSSNIPRASRTRVSYSLGVVLGRQPLVSSLSHSVVPTPAAVVNPPPDKVGSLVPTPSHGHSVNKDPVTSVELFKPIHRMDKGKQPMVKGFQHKRKRVVSVESNESIPR